MDSKDILAYVVSTKILDEYRLQDAYLNDLVTSVIKSPDEWIKYKNIKIANQPVPISRIERIVEKRLQHIPDENQISDPEEQLRIKELRIGLEQLGDYFKSHPDASVVTVAFNSDKYSYDVYCGLLTTMLNVICVIKGKHIPEDVFDR